MRAFSLAIKVKDSLGSGTSQFSVGDSRGKYVVQEEYRKSACEYLTCDLKTLFVLQRRDIQNV
jgi:hypothetical protein